MQRTSDRLVASRLLADRGWGKPATFESLEGDPLGLADAEAAAEAFRAKVLRHIEVRLDAHGDARGGCPCHPFGVVRID
jgi:hypothetical protein